MSGRLPVVSGAQLIRALERLGWQVVRQRGGTVAEAEAEAEADAERALVEIRDDRGDLIARRHDTLAAPPNHVARRLSS